ncbi:MAG TPA: acetolactate synthase [Planctomycetaceae bacterium]|nr:acetolactate synthase [Planctomycetaceae bacterium]
MPRLTGAQFLADTLHLHEVTHVFFVPAILNQTLAEMELRETGIDRVMTHGEKSAVYMADGFARVSGRPGITFAQCVGAANLAAALRDPYLACSPVVALTGGPYHDTRHRHTYQEIDDFSLFPAVTKSSTRVETIDRLPDAISRAFRDATSGTPGPTHIELLGHMGEIELEELDVELRQEPAITSVPATRTAAANRDVQQAVQVLQESHRPVIVAGGGVKSSGAGPVLLQLAETLGIPIATSLNAKDTIPANHPLNIGVPGHYCRKSANQALLDADLVFFVGSRTGSQVTARWKIPPTSTAAIQLDIAAEELGRHYSNRASLCGDAATVLGQMLEIVDATTADRRAAWRDNVASYGTAWRAEFASLLESNAVPLRPERICNDLTRLLPPDAILVSETGHSGMWTGGMIDLNHSTQSFIRAAGSLGWGLPATLGAKLAAPDRPVVLFSGDGGFWYHLSELETAARWNITCALIINNNRSLNQEIDLVNDAYAGEPGPRHGDLWQFSDASFAEIAPTMGARGIKVTRPGELDSALDEALSGEGPCVIEVMTEQTALAPLAWLGEEE